MTYKQNRLYQRALSLINGLLPFFSPCHVTWALGTAGAEQGRQIMEKGLYTGSPKLSATCQGFELSSLNMGTIVHLSYKAKIIVFIWLPRIIAHSLNTVSKEAHLFEPAAPEEKHLGEYKLPAKYIKGFYDVETGQAFLNPLFEAEPEMPPPIKAEYKSNSSH